jgi:transmembrane sensor
MSIETEAADWFARMRGPDADSARDLFAAWYADPGNAAAFDHLARTWDQAKFLAHSPTARARNLDLARPGGAWDRRAIALSAGALLAAALCIVMIGRSSGPDRQPAASVASTQSLSGSESPRPIALADGSHIILDRASRLEIAFSGSQRRLRLIAGRARFDVAHDTARPFIVEAGGGSVVAHGTMFDVALAPRGVEVVLLRGAVEVRDASPGVTPGHVRRLVPGQKVVMEAGLLTAPVAATRIDTSWPQPMIEFDAAPLGEAVAAFNRGGGPAIRVEDPAVRALRVTGAFPRGDPEGFAAALAATFGLEVRHGGDAGLILASRQSAGASKKP